MNPSNKTAVLWAVLVVVLALCAHACRGARDYEPVDGDPMHEPWRWRSFAEMHGLEAQCIAEGKDGTIWFGTADGLSSYDGFEWTRHLSTDGGILAGWVAAMCVEPDGTLDVGGWWGISQFRHGTWTRLVPSVGTRFADVRRLAMARDGSLWAATSWGALHRRQDTWTLTTDATNAGRLRGDERYHFLNIVLLPDAVLTRTRSSSLSANRADLTEVSCDEQGRIWFGTKGGEVLCHTPVPTATNPNLVAEAAARGAWTLYSEADGLVSGRNPCILPLRDGTLWVIPAPGEQLNVFDGTGWHTLPIPAPGVQPDGARLLQTRDGVVWLSTRYVLHAYRDGQWSSYQHPEVPIPQALNLLVQSTDGALWIAGPSTDTRRVDYQTPRWFTLRDLNFQWESPTGAQWFLHRDGRAVVREADRWTSYGVEDGFMDTPVALLGARDGVVWAAGSHAHTAATARFDGRQWTREIHADFSWGVDWRGLLESSDGSMWFGAAVDSSGPKEHRDGILQYRDGAWIHHHQPGRSSRADGSENAATLLPPGHRPEPIEKFSCLGESRDGRIWGGRNVLAFHNGTRWEELFPTEKMRFGIIESMLTTVDRELWIGTRQYGAFHYDGRSWSHHQGKGSLLANSVRSLAQSTDGSIWAATDRGFSRFDGNTWMDDALPVELSLPHDGGNLRSSPSGTLWINRHTINWNQRAWKKATPPAPDAAYWTVCHQFAGPPPRTMIMSGAEVVSHPGNLSVLWSGAEPWREPGDVRLQFSFRLDDQPWSAFTSDGGQSFFTLPSGHHRLEVRARDQDFNVDPTPATLDFIVLPPVWRQAWFLILMIVLGVLLGAQTFRVLLEKRRLQIAHDKLEERVRQRTSELEVANRELESFSYSVSHDLRAPLRSIDGFSRILQVDYDAKLDDEGRESLDHIRRSAQRMGHLIDAMMQLSRVTRGTLRLASVDLSACAQEIIRDLAREDPEHTVSVSIAPDVVVAGDPALLRNVLENLLGNAWKFAAKCPNARIEFGVAERNGETIYFVRDNGAGFDRSAARNLFGAFQRFHSASEFSGTGIGLATVQRIIHRHGGRIDAESRVGEGAMFFFTLPRSTESFD